MRTLLRAALFGLALAILAGPAAAGNSPNTKNVRGPTYSKTYRAALKVTTGDVIRIDCVSETPWDGTGDEPVTRPHSWRMVNEDASINVYVRGMETDGTPPVDTSNVDTSGATTDQLFKPLEDLSFTTQLPLQVAVKQASGTPTIRIDYECSGRPGY